MEPERTEHYEQIYDGRERVVETELDARQGFLFDLERWSNDRFMPFSSDMSDAQREDRGSLVDRVRFRLERRVNLRSAGRVPDRPPARDDIEAITGIFVRAARHLRGGPYLGEVLLDFAAGDLGRSVQWHLNGEPQTYRVAEPDSGYVFLFAELGLVGRSYDIAFWTERLILDLVKMQRYFMARFPFRAPSWRQYPQPLAPLCPQARARIDGEYRAYASDLLSIETLEALMAANLRRPERPRRADAQAT